jgi:probable F420-dependent oxidoreductase
VTGAEPALRFGCVARSPAASRADWLDRVRAVDRAGFDVLLLPDHLGVWPPFTPLVAAAEASDRLRFGTQVLNIGFWSPALLAREAAAVDVLTDGRLELGFGAGHAEDEFRAVGAVFPAAGERVDHLTEAVPLVRRLLAGEEVTADGHYPLDRCSTGLTTTQSPVPVMIGGNGDRVLGLAARCADTVGLVGFTARAGQPHPALTHFGWDGLADRIGHVRAAAPGRFDDLEISVLVQAVVLTDDRAGVADMLGKSFGQPPDVVLDSPFVMVGSAEEVADHVRRLRHDHGVGYITVFEPFADALAPVIERLR